MGAERVIGNQGPSDKIGTLWFDPFIDMIAPIGIGPAIKAAILDRSHVVGRDVGTKLVALVDGNP